MQQLGVDPIDLKLKALTFVDISPESTNEWLPAYVELIDPALEGTSGRGAMESDEERLAWRQTLSSMMALDCEAA